MSCKYYRETEEEYEHPGSGYCELYECLCAEVAGLEACEYYE